MTHLKVALVVSHLSLTLKENDQASKFLEAAKRELSQVLASKDKEESWIELSGEDGIAARLDAYLDSKVNM
jgi:hypothetical protein